jgi:hypothetical protein
MTNRGFLPTSPPRRRTPVGGARQRLRLALVILLLLPLPSAAAGPSPEGIDFFEKKVRPVLAEHCYACHGPKSEPAKGGLRLSSRDGWRKGGGRGPAVRENDPDGSLLINAVRHADPALRMPPDKKLTDAQVADLAAWVRMGAPDPRTGAGTPDPGSIAERARRHWAFQPVRRPDVPAVRDPAWVRTPVDAFVLANLERHGLRPSPPAGRRALIRRVTFDLTGLPPTPEEVEAFESDGSPGAYGRVVERLLASPAYGERWGRHWLDVARYADTKGYVSNEADNRYFHAYTYRDYVIRAFNDDLPFDQFIREQLAADQLPPGADNRSLAALGFLTLGRRHLNSQPEILDDRIDVVTRGLLGLTVGCARCHDHKYDPVPAEDYYSLYGVFLSSPEPEEGPLLGGAAPTWEFELELADRQNALRRYRRELEDAQLARIRGQGALYLRTVHEAGRIAEKQDQDQLALERGLDLQVMQRWRDRLKPPADGGPDPVFGPWAAFAALPEGDFAAQARALTQRLAADGAVNPLVARAVLSGAPASFQEVCERYGRLFAEVDRRWQELIAEHARRREGLPPPAVLPDPDAEAVRRLALYGTDAPPDVPRNQLDRFFDRPSKNRLVQLQLDVNDVLAEHPGSPPRAPVVLDAPRPQTARVLLRGDASKPGPEAPRRFLKVLAGPHRAPFPAEASGRLQLARAIASPANPLTARVFANRAWAWHFGSPLVRTPSDFGLRAEPPTHPELLDYLAWRFVADGWSVKRLHRLLVLSAAYQQSDADDPAGLRADPENRWYARMNRRRLEYEPLRDALLTASGRLDRTMGGRPVDLLARPYASRRAVYGFLDRNDFPDQLRAFDVVNPEKTVAQRPGTAVPQQALFFLNNELVIEQARALAADPALRALAADEGRVQWLYRRLFQRSAGPEEVRLALEFVRAQEGQPAEPPPAPEESAWQYGAGAYDPAARRVRDYVPLGHFDGAAWTAGPDGGAVRLTAEGGHAGTGPRGAAVRRWVAPRDAVVRITGELARPSGARGPVRGRVVSSRHAEVGAWEGEGRRPTAVERLEVKAGDVVDFVVDAPAGGEFLWSPRVRVIEVVPGERGGLVSDWRAGADFRGPPAPLGPWEKYAHVLLMTNEFAFDH